MFELRNNVVRKKGTSTGKQASNGGALFLACWSMTQSIAVAMPNSGPLCESSGLERWAVRIADKKPKRSYSTGSVYPLDARRVSLRAQADSCRRVFARVYALPFVRERPPARMTPTVREVVIGVSIEKYSRRVAASQFSHSAYGQKVQSTVSIS